MTFEDLKNALPEPAKDIKLNLSSLANETALTETQRAGTFIVSAVAARNAQVLRAILAEFAPKLSKEELAAAQSAGAIMGMNNVYYRFTHLASSPDYRTMPAKLRMNAMAKPGVDKTTFELWSLAVSAINGCGMCIDSHEKVLREHGVSAETIQAAVRIGAVVQATAVILDANEAFAELTHAVPAAA
jgi:alkyl hydroperoxide reductase subunit D